jgi:hypothetical protein
MSGLLAAMALIGVFLLAPMTSNADIIKVANLDFKGNSQGEVITVNIGSFINATTLAGFYNAILTVPEEPSWTGNYEGLGFCAEAAAIYIYPTYLGYSLYELTPPYTNAAWLMSTYLGSATDSYNTASLQVAIWEALLDPNHFDLTSGNFALLGGLDPTKAKEMLTALSNADLSSFNTAPYRIASDDGLGTTSGIQDLIVYNAAVPIPSGLLLLGSGLIAFIGLRRTLARR